MISSSPEGWKLAAFLFCRLDDAHREEARALVPEFAAVEWVLAHRGTERKVLAERMARRWRVSKSTAYRCLACIDASDLSAAGAGSP